MSGKMRMRTWGFLGVLAVFAGIILALSADAQGTGTWLKVKARFLSGYGLGVKDPAGISIPNKIVNDDPDTYYENVGNTIIELIDDPKQGKVLFLSIVTDRRSSRHVNLFLDAVVSGPGQNLPSYCAKPYFLDMAPIETTKLFIKAGGEWEMIDRDDPAGFPTLKPKDGELNFLTMTDGQEAYVYTGFFYFNVPDLTATRKVNESGVDYWFTDCLWAKVKAGDWDGQKVNTWIFTPVTEPFKHAAWGNPSEWCLHPEGAIPYLIHSNASLSCNQGTYRMPWELEITRLK